MSHSSIESEVSSQSSNNYQTGGEHYQTGIVTIASQNTEPKSMKSYQYGASDFLIEDAIKAKTYDLAYKLIQELTRLSSEKPLIKALA
jgi:hypothetical protein